MTAGFWSLSDDILCARDLRFAPRRGSPARGGAFFGPREPAESGLLGSVKLVAQRARQNQGSLAGAVGSKIGKKGRKSEHAIASIPKAVRVGNPEFSVDS